MTTLLDTSAALGLIERRSPEIREVVARLDDALLRSSFVTAELLHGVESATGSDRDERQATLDRWLRITVAPDTAPTLEVLPEPYSRISALAGPLRSRIGQNDRWILAEANVLGVSRIITEDLGQANLAREWFRDGDVEVIHVASSAPGPRNVS